MPSLHPIARLKAEDLATLPDDEYRHELEAGWLLSEPLPSPRHDRIRRRLERILHAFVSEHALGEVFGETGFVLARDPDTVRGPDLSFVRADRLAGFDDTCFFDRAPDFAVVVLSSSNRASEARSRVADCLAAGCPLVWVVDSEKKSVVTYRTILSPRRVDLDGTLDGEDVLRGFRVDVAAIFGEGVC